MMQVIFVRRNLSVLLYGVRELLDRKSFMRCVFLQQACFEFIKLLLYDRMVGIRGLFSVRVE
jgi:hypothetical protein